MQTVRQRQLCAFDLPGMLALLDPNSSEQDSASGVNAMIWMSRAENGAVQPAGGPDRW